MNRRDFLRLLAVTVTAAVAGLRPRPEQTEMVMRRGNGSQYTLDNFGIPAKDIKLAIHRLCKTVRGVDLEDDEIVLEPVGIISPVICKCYHQLVELGQDQEQAWIQAVMENEIDSSRLSG